MRTAALLFLAIPITWGQQAISAHSGLVHYVENDASVAGPDLQMKTGQFWEVKPGQTLSTKDGHAEVLLNPGVFLRLDQNSSFRMIENALTDSHVQLVTGRAMIEVLELQKGNQVTIHVGEMALLPAKEGLYLIDAKAGEAKVYEGMLTVRRPGSSLELGRGKMTTLGPLPLVSKFDRKDTDFELYTWSASRSGRIAQANLNVASSLGQTRAQPIRGVGMWSFYPSLGMFTYLPAYGRIHNPFGWYYYSPYYVWGVYNRIYSPVQSYSGSAENASWGNRPSSGTYSAPAAVAASSGSVAQSVPTSAPAVRGTARDR